MSGSARSNGVESAALLSGAGERRADQCELIRTVPSSVVLRRCAAVFGVAPVYFAISSASGRGGEAAHGDLHDALWNLGAPADSIDDFVSHSWSDSRLKKCLALLYYYNGRLALAVAMALSAVVFAGGVAVRLGAPSRAMGPFWVWLLCLDLPAAVYLAVLCFGHRITCNAVGSRVWLDKICVHQGDPERKAMGIRLIGDILRRSRRMIILHSDAYSSRLWCVYELGQFLASSPVDSLRFLSLDTAMFTLAGFFCSVGSVLSSQWHFQSAAEDLEHVNDQLGEAMWVPTLAVSAYWVIAFSPFSIPLAAALAARLATQSSVNDGLSTFTVSAAACTVESDRAVVEGALREAWGDLSRFEDTVRTEVKAYVADVLGAHTRVPYSAQLVLWMPLLWNGFCDILSTPDEIVELQVPGWKTYVVVNMWFFGCQAFFLFPLLLQAFLKWVRLCTKLSNWRCLSIPLSATGMLLCIFAGHFLLVGSTLAGGALMGTGIPGIAAAMVIYVATSVALFAAVRALY